MQIDERNRLVAAAKKAAQEEADRAKAITLTSDQENELLAAFKKATEVEPIPDATTEDEAARLKLILDKA